MKTSSGVELKINSISPMLIDRVNQSIPVPPVPTYEAKTITGEVEIHEHDLTTLDTPEAQKEWAEYEKALAERSSLVTQRMLDVFILRGLDIELPEDDSWAEDQVFLGIDVPTDERALKIHYVLTEVLQTASDLTGLTSAVMAKTGVSPEVLANVEASFRRTVEGEAAGDADPGNTE